jgi:2-polyprenyl-3-methyl-5-hydroxy-6-metoxy-1,4-benzoquinol methylase
MNWTCSVCGSTDAAGRQRLHSRFRAFRERKLVTCRHCSTKTVHPVPNAGELANINQTYWESTGTGGSGARDVLFELAKHRVAYLSSYAGSLEGKRILDIGAGHAYPYDAIKLMGINSDYCAVESDDEMREELAQKGVTTYSHLSEVADQSFDLVILSHVVEHVESPVEFLKEASTCLSDDGIMFVEVPNQDDLFKLDLGLHLAVYNPTAISELCKHAGLLPREISTAGMAIADLRPTLVGRFENRLKHANRLLYRVWRRARKVLSVGIPEVDSNAPLSRNDDQGRWLRVLATKRKSSVA